MDVRAAAALVNEALKPLVVCENALERERLWERKYFSTYKLGVMGTRPEAIAGIDIALWDILGKVTGQSLSQLFGGRRHAAKAAEDGHSMVKIRMDWGARRTDANPAHDWAVLSKARNALGDKIELGFDANNGILRHDRHPPFDQKAGYLAVPDEPGLGIEVDEAELRKWRAA